MSNVLKRKRNLSYYEFYNNAVKIRNEVLDITNNEKYVPKRRRMTIGSKTLNHALDIIEYIVKANTSFPSTPELLFMRKYYQQKAINECEALIECIKVIIEIHKVGKVNRLMSIIYTTSSEIDLLRRWMRSTKITSHSKKYLERIDQQEQQDEQQNVDSDSDVKEPTVSTTTAKPNMDVAANNLLLLLIMLLEDTSKFKNLV